MAGASPGSGGPPGAAPVVRPPATQVIDPGAEDRLGRRISLRPVDDDSWRAVADVAPTDEQRRFVAPTAARYVLLSAWEGVWTSMGVWADGQVVGHAMWGWDPDDGCHWVGGVVTDAAEQGRGVGRAAMVALAGWLLDRGGGAPVRLSYEPANAPARRLYTAIGFTELDLHDGDEVVAELVPGALRRG